MALAGWAFNIGMLTNVAPGFTSMKANTALALVLSGASLWFSLRRNGASRVFPEQVLGLVVCALGVLTLAQDLLNVNLGIDELLLRDPASAAIGTSPGRMSPVTSVCLCLFGFALAFLDVHIGRAHPASLFALTGVSISLIALIGHAYNVAALLRIGSYSSMAPETAVTLFILGVGVLHARPNLGFMRIISSTGVGGVMLRRILPVAVMVPLLLGWLRLWGERAGLFELAFGVALFALSNMLIFSFLLWRNAALVDRAEREREVTEERFRLAVESAPNAMVMLNDRGSIMLINSQAEILFGYSRDELIGKSVELLVPERYRTGHANYRDTFFSDPRARMMGAGRELLARKKDGSEVPVEIGLNMIRSREGSLVLSVIVDITERKRAEQNLKASEERKQALVQSALDGIITIDDRGAIVEFNPAAERIFGYRAEQVKGKTMAELIVPPPLRASHYRGMERFLHTGHGAVLGKRVELSAVRSDGSEFPVEVSILRVGSGDPPMFTGFVRDITERKRAEEKLMSSESRYRTTLDHMLEGAQIIGFDWRYLYINEVGTAHGRRGKEELIGKTMMEAYPGIENTPVFTELRRCMEDRVPSRMENEFTFPDGSKGWFDLSMEPVPEGTFVLSKDITKEKELDEELRRHREHLEELVVQRTAQLEAVNKELEAFSYSVSHDLRAPLRHINGFIDLLKQGIGKTLDEKNRRYVNVISDSALRMGVLIDDLLGFSRMSRTELLRTKVSLERLVNDVIAELTPTETGRRVTWHIGALPAVEADPAMMRLAILNLISNAMKYTRTREEARIEVGARREGRETIFFVRDNGVGFDMQYAEKLYGVFQRLHRADEFEGTGIGLANVRRIIQRHGGRTWAEGKLGEGATFYCSLPDSDTEKAEP